MVVSVCVHVSPKVCVSYDRAKAVCTTVSTGCTAAMTVCTGWPAKTVCGAGSMKVKVVVEATMFVSVEAAPSRVTVVLAGDVTVVTLASGARFCRPGPVWSGLFIRRLLVLVAEDEDEAGRMPFWHSLVGDGGEAGAAASPKIRARRCTPGTPAGICILWGKTVQMGSACSGRRGVRQVGVTTIAVLVSTWDQRVKVWVLVETWVTADLGGVMVWVKVGDGTVMALSVLGTVMVVLATDVAVRSEH